MGAGRDEGAMKDEAKETEGSSDKAAFFYIERHRAFIALAHIHPCFSWWLAYNWQLANLVLS
jgi:hypothetical protein